ncbi:metallophosphoesterase [Thioclava sp. GXIMD2076]|uniref:Metallophosphoesterase n=1 Tax=Thioclava kandeliae TaxID=3070818 RepID=A0ABV1SCS1_9RHOB
MRAYAIGDIHGHLDKLKIAHDLIEQDRAACGDTSAPVIHVGDVADRGPDSAGVIDYLIASMRAGKNWVVLKGNHDRMFSIFMNDPFDADPMLRKDLTWLNPRLGGDTTLASYGVLNADERPADIVHAEALQKVPESHILWLGSRPNHFIYGDLLFVHAGIRPGVSIGNQTEDDLCWIRKGWLEDTTDHGCLVVHGHTALDQVTHYGNRLNLDSSAGYGGPVSAVVIEGRDAWLLTENGRQPLVPMSVTAA